MNFVDYIWIERGRREREREWEEVCIFLGRFSSHGGYVFSLSLSPSPFLFYHCIFLYIGCQNILYNLYSLKVIYYGSIISTKVASTQMTN